MGGAFSNDMDLPFEETTGSFKEADSQFAGGVVVMAGVIDVPGIGPTPTLVFRFTTPLGGFYPPMVLVCDDDQMSKVVPLVEAAAATAIAGAQARR